MFYRVTHLERKELVKRWKKAIKQMNERVDEIQLAENELETVVFKSISKDDQITKVAEEAKQIFSNNRKCEESIKMCSCETSAIKEQIKYCLQNVAHWNRNVGIA